MTNASALNSRSVAACALRPKRRSGNRLRRQLHVFTEGGRELLLNDLSADRGEVVTFCGPAVKRSGVQLDVLAPFLFFVAPATAHDRFLVAGGAADRVEERTEPRLWREFGLEY